jgi:hypothetical protein
MARQQYDQLELLRIRNSSPSVSWREAMTDVPWSGGKGFRGGLGDCFLRR